MGLAGGWWVGNMEVLKQLLLEEVHSLHISWPLCYGFVVKGQRAFQLNTQRFLSEYPRGSINL